MINISDINSIGLHQQWNAGLLYWKWQWCSTVVVKLHLKEKGIDKSIIGSEPFYVVQSNEINRQWVVLYGKVILKVV